MRYALPFVLLPLLACGPPDTAGMEKCMTSFASTYSAAGCDGVEADVELARVFLVGTGTMSEQAWGAYVRDFTLFVASAQNFEGPYGTASGFTGADWVEVGADRLALVHEALHTHDVRCGVLTTASHPGWLERGYLGLDELYGAALRRVDISHCDTYQVTAEQREALKRSGIDVDALYQRIKRVRTLGCGVSSG